MLIALGRGDKYRLTHIRETLERNKELFISDKNFLDDLVKTHLKDKIYQARIVSISEKTDLFCEECGSEIPADEKFCTSCGTQKLEPETKQEAESVEEQASGGFAFTADGDIGESSTKETARESLTKKISELETKLDEHTKATRETARIELKLEPKKKSRQQELEEYENEYLSRSEKPQASGGFAFTADGDIGGSSTRETAREDLTKKISALETKLKQTNATKSRQQELEEYEKKYLKEPKTKVSRKTYKVKATRKIAQIKLKPEPKKKSRQQELEEYEKKYLNESESNVSWQAYDVKAKRKVEIQNPKAVKMKNGKWAVKGTSPITGIKVFRIVGNEKPAISAEKTADSPKAKKEPATLAEKHKGSQKTEPEVFSRYYRSPEAESPKVKKSKSKKSNLFCEECGSKIAAKDMFCTNCGAKR